MRRLDIDELMAYCHCPMYYYLKYRHHDKKNHYVNTIEKYNLDLHRAVYSFYSMIQNGESPSLSILKRAWGRLWIGKKSAEEFIVTTPTSWRDSYESRRKRGIDSIVKFYEQFKVNPGFPLAINTPYELQLGGDLILTGRWEIIREVEVRPGQREIQLLNFKVDDKVHNAIYMEKDLDITASSYAFRQQFNQCEDRLICYGLDKGKFHSVVRDETEYNMLKHTARCVQQAIDQQLFYACPKASCYQCLYRNQCHHFLNEVDFNQFKGEDVTC